MRRSIEKLSYGRHVLAIIVRAQKQQSETHFFSPPDAPLQAGTVVKKKGGVILPHLHQNVMQKIKQFQEVLFVERGKAKLSLYTPRGKLLFERIIKSGDKVLLAFGAHGFQILEDTVFFDVKQGPYPGYDKAKEFLDKP